MSDGSYKIVEDEIGPVLPVKTVEVKVLKSKEMNMSANPVEQVIE